MKKLLTTIVCLILLMGTSMMNARPPMYTSTNTEVPSVSYTHLTLSTILRV